jgi:hypothetical protein
MPEPEPEPEPERRLGRAILREIERTAPARRY